MGTMRDARIGPTDTPPEVGANKSAVPNPFGDEYKILQDKIDKIGAARITIKGWSVTATIGVLLTIASNRGFSSPVTAVGLDVLLAFFFLFERQQVRLGWMFNARARNIEIQIDKFRRAAGERVLFSSPNIARSLFGAKKPRDTEPFAFKNRKLEKARTKLSLQLRIAIGSDLAFYLALGFSAWLPMYVTPPAPPEPTPVVIQNSIQLPKQAMPLLGPGPTGSPPPSHSKSSKGGAN